MNHRRRLFAGGAALLTVFAAMTLSSTAGFGQETYLVRDEMTGYALPQARAVVEDQVTHLRTVDTKADTVGRMRLPALPEGKRVLFSADGYKEMAVTALGPKVSGQMTTVWLPPLERPEELLPEVVEARRLPGMTMLHGHVVDVATGRPVEGARVHLEIDGAETVTDERGYFLLYAKGLRVLAPEDVPDLDDIVVEARGYSRVRLADVPMLEQDAHFIVDLERGNGEKLRDMSHKMFGRKGDRRTWPQLHKTPDASGEGEASRIALKGGLQVMNPLDSIYVNGYGWYYLETYVSRGLCAEWISSWGTHSLDAGAVAYRSYGSWWQTNYGYICATTGCQVYNNTFVQKCADAAQRTSGILLQKNGSIAFSEYSAENNSYVCGGYSCVNSDLSCGNGSAGSPSAGWSCLSDGHTYPSGGPGACCFGHGHGMCQWGTQGWYLSGKRWNWMVDHYYNNFGSGTGNRTMYMTTPVEIVAGSASPTSVNAGSSFTVNATLRSYTDYNHSLLLGATLTGPGTLTDPAHDTAVTALARTTYSVQSRDSAVSRSFSVPGSAASGTYNMVLEIWYDSDGDNQIDGTDKLLHQATYNNAVTVGGGGSGWTQTVDDNAAYLGGPSEYWWEVTGYGINNQMHYTWNAQSSGTNFIYWYFNVPQNGYYKVEVFIPRNHATTTSARYYVHDGTLWQGPYYVNQNVYYDEWVTLTTSVYLPAGTRIVYVGDVTGETTGTRKVGVDAARMTLQ